LVSELTFLSEWWSGLDIKLYGTKEDFDMLGKESAICLSNHRSDVDWLIGYTVADRAGVLAVSAFSSLMRLKDQGVRATTCGLIFNNFSQNDFP